jgi:hypothetical protein
MKFISESVLFFGTHLSPSFVFSRSVAAGDNIRPAALLHSAHTAQEAV